jgi:malate dehydrogenase
MHAVKVTIVGGAGGVGASTAFNLLRSGCTSEVVLVDSRTNHVASHVMDLDQTLEQVSGDSVRGGDQADIVDADVLVLTASVPLTVNASRFVYLVDNARILDEIADVLPREWHGIAIVVTNPVDPLVTRLQARTGIDRYRILGYTLNDSLRLRTGIGRTIGTAPGTVDAWVLGEHGDSGVPLWSRITVQGEPRRLSAEDVAAAEEYFRSWYVRHVALDSGRSSTWTSGLGVARMVTAIGKDAGVMWPASLVLAGEYGIDGVAVTVPVTLGARGASSVLEWELADEERAALQASAEVVRRVVASI